jgi:hypothetical protein
MSSKYKKNIFKKSDQYDKTIYPDSDIAEYNIDKRSKLVSSSYSDEDTVIKKKRQPKSDTDSSSTTTDSSSDSDSTSSSTNSYIVYPNEISLYYDPNQFYFSNEFPNEMHNIRGLNIVSPNASLLNDCVERFIRSFSYICDIINQPTTNIPSLPSTTNISPETKLSQPLGPSRPIIQEKKEDESLFGPILPIALGAVALGALTKPSAPSIQQRPSAPSSTTRPSTQSITRSSLSSQSTPSISSTTRPSISSIVTPSAPSITRLSTQQITKPSAQSRLLRPLTISISPTSSPLTPLSQPLSPLSPLTPLSLTGPVITPFILGPKKSFSERLAMGETKSLDLTDDNIKNHLQNIVETYNMINKEHNHLYEQVRDILVTGGRNVEEFKPKKVELKIADIPTESLDNFYNKLFELKNDMLEMLVSMEKLYTAIKPYMISNSMYNNDVKTLDTLYDNIQQGKKKLVSFSQNAKNTNDITKNLRTIFETTNRNINIKPFNTENKSLTQQPIQPQLPIQSQPPIQQPIQSPSVKKINWNYKKDYRHYSKEKPK